MPLVTEAFYNFILLNYFPITPEIPKLYMK